jgi:uncharacterized protein (PEP-CTERM system associated)
VPRRGWREAPKRSGSKGLSARRAKARAGLGGVQGQSPWLAAAALLLAAPAHAQPLPDTGTTVEIGGLRQQLEGLLATGTTLQPGTGTTPGWTITPALGVEERWTDHLQNLVGENKSAFVTALDPSVLINGDTARTNTTLTYNPALEHYSSGGYQDRITQNLNASSQLTLVPERLFLDLRGYTSMQSVTGGYGPNGTAVLSRQNETQLTAFSAHPYLRQRFGDLASAEAGAVLSRTSQSSLAASPGQLPLSAQNFLSGQEYLDLASGPDLGRTSADLNVSASQSSGTGVMNNAHSADATLQLGYAITRNLTALASLGYQDIHYNGSPPFNYSGPSWSGGAHWVPNPDSSITATYGRREGVDSAQLDASYAVGARTRIYARYSEGLTSGLEQLLNAVNSTVLDPQGNPVDRTNTPVQIADFFYGVTDNLARLSTASVTATLLLERNAISASFNRQQSHQVAAASAGAGPQNTSGFYVSLTWQRDLRPNLTASTYVQWGTWRNTLTTGGQNFDSLVFSLKLAYLISETLSAYGQYSYTRQSNAQIPGAVPLLPANLIVIGARKTF